ncbi:hypothetical protein K4039_18780 [Lyngbya sp. CCAP 1446/10]|uniref:hypothetical protein n=1 Tax=Lyngbya sp. CCAP 1446/10 TaxID=439293 RepID=UPI002237C351|nr:hypothetical protein [Lyngbya sp. CCAP 1446/10]MCW6052082.1 hypothetical protein [Lyngbya sp. CCAP 1446/10]
MLFHRSFHELIIAQKYCRVFFENRTQDISAAIPLKAENRCRRKKEDGRGKNEDGRGKQGRGEREARRKAVGNAFSLLSEVRWVLFTMSSIAPNAESNTNSIEQTAFLTIKPPRPLFAVPAFAAFGPATNTQTIELVGAETPGFIASHPKF